MSTASLAEAVPDASRARRDRELQQAWAELTAAGAAYEVGLVDVRGQTLRRFLRGPADLREVWLSTAGFGDRPYLVFEGERTSYGQAHTCTRAVGAWLAGRGVAAGDRVAIAMRNYPEWLLIYWGCLSMGAVPVGMNAWWVAEEMAHAVADAAPKVVFCDAERLERLARSEAPRIDVVAVRARAPEGVTSWNEVMATLGAAPEPAVDPDDDACIFYTSGTTGTPKGAQLTHRGCINNLVGLQFAVEVHAMAGARASDTPRRPAPEPVGLVTTPLFHVTANNCLAHVLTAAGGTIVLMRKWDAGEALRLIETERVTNMSGVPTMARELVRHPDVTLRDLSSLAVLSGGGAQLPRELVGQIDDLPSSARPSTGYGMTETCGILSAVAADFFKDRPDSCGRLLPTFEARLLDDDGLTLPDGATGELCVKGGGVIKGYLNKPEATAATIVDGWLHTGDMARIDEIGFIHLVDRKKDLILRGGENVSCAEVEAALHRHPAVAEACAFGVPDVRLGEEVGAAVKLVADAAATADELRSCVSLHLAFYKAPRFIWILAEPLPRNASGKFLRKELRTTLRVEDAC